MSLVKKQGIWSETHSCVKTSLLVIILIFASFPLLSQTDTVIIRGEPFYDPYPKVFLILDTANVELDSLSAKSINPKWIKKIEVMKGKEYEQLYGNNDGVIYIFPKKRYKKRILINLEKDF